MTCRVLYGLRSLVSRRGGPNRPLLTSAPHTSNTLDGRAFHVAVVGSGPAGFYLSASLLRLNKDANIDFFEKQPVPFGLARFGVAPDHPEVKNCINQFGKLMGSEQRRIRFYGNVSVGNDVTIEELRQSYDVVVCAYGAANDRRMNVPGENARNCISARQFVGWYNGAPECQDLQVDLNVRDVCIVGQGNVALDVARILLSPVERLSHTDTTEKALHALRHSTVQTVTLIGRRGPLQVAFTIKELREMINLTGCHARLDPTDYPQLSKEDLKRLPRPRQRITDLLLKTAFSREKPCDLDSPKHWSLKFMRSPKRVIEDGEGSVIGLEMTVNEYDDTLIGVRQLNTAVDWTVNSTTQTDRILCGLLFVSIGYQSVQMPGLPYDSRKNVIDTIDTIRVKDNIGVYACGWCAHGATGVIASTQIQSAQAAQAIHNDIQDGAVPVRTERGSGIERTLQERAVDWVSWPQWLRLDSAEIQRGQARGKPREKITDVHDMMQIVKDQ